MQDLLAHPQWRAHSIHDSSGLKVFQLQRQIFAPTLLVCFTGYSVQEMTDMFQQINDAMLQISTEFTRINVKFDKEFHAVFNELTQFQWIADYYDGDFIDVDVIEI